MSNQNNASSFLASLERSFSKKRLDGYRMQGGTDEDAIAKYVWNTLLCESLYPCFQILEVAFRNSAHTEIGIVVKDHSWLLNQIGILYPSEKEAIQSARKSVELTGKTPTENILVAEMKFGFWTSLLDSRYDKLWHKIIAGVFPHMPKTTRTRGDAAKLMNTVRRLRNAALHHHSIWHWKDLNHQHAQMRLLISYLCKSSDFLAQQIDRFPNVYSLGPGPYKKIAAECLR
jgi:Abi-like protein